MLPERGCLLCCMSGLDNDLLLSDMTVKVICHEVSGSFVGQLRNVLGQ